MSRIARLPVPLADGIDFHQAGDTVTVKGPKGELSSHIPAALVKITKADSALKVDPASEAPEARAASGLVRTLLDKLVRGATEEFKKAVELSGVGYRAVAEGNKLTLSVGYSHPIVMAAPEGISVEVKKNTITIAGADAQAVGQFAANIRAVRPPEPYKGKGIHYVGEHVRRKAGKAGKAAE